MSEILFFRVKDSLKKVILDEVGFLEAEDNYTHFHTRDEKFMVRMSMSAALKKLPPGRFVQVHRSFAVNISYIETVNKETVELGGTELPVSRIYYSRLLKELNILE